MTSDPFSFYRASVDTLLTPLENDPGSSFYAGAQSPWATFSQDGHFVALSYATYFGEGPALGIQQAFGGAPTWIGLPLAPKCDGCAASSFAGSNYVFCDTPKAWSDAESHCASLGGHLASVHDKGEQSFLRSLAPNAGSSWIGLRAPLENGVFTWIDESPVDWLDWLPGQPDNAGGHEQCVEQVDRFTFASWSSTRSNATFWNDGACATPLSFVCKIDGGAK